MEKYNEGCSRFFVGFIVKPAIPLLIALGIFGLTTNGFIHGESVSVAVGFLVMIACFWGSFIVLFKQFHIMAKGVNVRLPSRWVIVALFLSILAGLFLIRDFFDPKSLVSAQKAFMSIQSAASVVCQGGKVPVAGAYRSGDDPHIVLVSGAVARGKFNAEWKPGSLGHVELVACLDSPTYTLIQTCRYTKGGTVERYREDQSVRLMVAQTGEVLASKVLTALPGDCPSSKLENDEKKLRGSVTHGLIEGWVLSVLPSRTYTPTPAPTRIQAPTSTPLPVEVTFDTLGNYPTGHLIILVGRLVLTNNIECSLSDCGLVLENPANPSQKITVFIPVGVKPNQMKPLPDPYTKSDIQVQLNDGTFAVVGYRLRVTGRVCSSTSKESCISDITRIELFQLK